MNGLVAALSSRRRVRTEGRSAFVADIPERAKRAPLTLRLFGIALPRAGKAGASLPHFARDRCITRVGAQR